MHIVLRFLTLQLTKNWNRSWVSCFAKLCYHCGKPRHCQELVRKVESEASSSTQLLIGDSIDTVEWG